MYYTVAKLLLRTDNIYICVYKSREKKSSKLLYTLIINESNSV